MHQLATVSDFRQDFLPILEAALQAVDPRQAVLSHVSLTSHHLKVGNVVYDLDALQRIVVVGAGKAGAPMAAALTEVLGSRISAGLVNVKYGHTAGAGGWSVRFGRAGEMPTARPAQTGPITISQSAHPVPDAAGQAAAEQIASLLSDLTERDLALVLISGGGSALLPLPVPGVTLTDLQALTTAMLRSGADITELNVVRKHCSQVQGGQLARIAAPAQVATLVLSDVVGSPLDSIASGPTVPDRSTYADALGVLRKYQILEQVPQSIRTHIMRGAAGELADTPKPGDPLFERVNNVIVGDNASAGRAAVAAAAGHGWHSQLLTTYLQGEAREVGKVCAGLAQGIALGASTLARPACLVMGGETTVTVKGQGMGGRNQELALAAALALDHYPLPEGIGAAVISLGTDGTDGPTDAAGGLALADSAARGRALGLNGADALAANDSYHYLSELGDLLITGPTNTNVNDLVFICVW